MYQLPSGTVENISTFVLILHFFLDFSLQALCSHLFAHSVLWSLCNPNPLVPFYSSPEMPLAIKSFDPLLVGGLVMLCITLLLSKSLT